MKTEGNNSSNVIWGSNIELPQLTPDECLPVIGNCQITSIFSNLEPLEKNLPHCLEIPQSMELIVLHNRDLKLQSRTNTTIIKEESKIENNQTETKKEKIKPIKTKEKSSELTYVFCDLCPFVTIKKSRLAEHLLNTHANGNVLPMTKLKCPACANVFFHKISLRSHLIYDHMVINSDLYKIMQRSHLKNKTADNAKVKKHMPMNTDGDCRNELDLKDGNKLSEKIFNDELPIVPNLTSTTSDVIEANLDLGHQKENNPVSVSVNLPTLDIMHNNAEKMFSTHIKKENTLSKFLHNKKQYKCNILPCKVQLQNIDKLNYHIKCHVDSSFKCPECNEGFFFWKPLIGHLWRVHKIDMELYSCDECDYKTFSLGKLNNIHKLIHGDIKPFICDVCPKAFKNSKQLRNHKTAHKEKSDSTMYYCDICTKAFSVKRQLRIHTDGVHRKIKPFLCNFCGYKGASRSALRMHMRQHTGEKPFACDSCSYTTADHNSLRRHKLRHTGEKPYKCTHCEYACIQSSTYKVHLKTKHPGLEKDLLFSCPECSFRSINKDMFNAHFTSIHKQKA